MPRPRSLENEEEPIKKVVRRAPRQRTVAVPVAEESPREGELPLETNANVPVPTLVRTPTRRRAPRVVQLPEEQVEVLKRERRPYVFYSIIVGIFLASIGVSAVVGFMDKGTIDVAARISEQNAIQASTGGDTGETNMVIPVQNSAPPSVPNGGLVGQGVLAASPPPPLPVEPQATTSSSTLPVDSALTTPATKEDTTEETPPPTEPAETPATTN